MTTLTEHDTRTLQIDGMHCAACVRRVERALTKVDGVAEASADFIAGRAVIEVDQLVGDDALSAAISGAGYELRTSVEDPANQLAELAPLALRAAPALLIGWGIFFAMQANRWGDFGWNIDLFFPILFAVTTPTLAWSVWPMLRRAALAASRRTTDMDTLVVLGVAAAWGYSATAALAPGVFGDDRRDVFFDTALIIVGFVSLGRALEARVRLRAAATLTHLLELTPQTARVLRDGVESHISAADVRAGDMLRVRPGEQISVDGEIIDGESAVDESMLSGESVPVAKAAGNQVFAGTLNLDGAFTYRATQVGAFTALARITAAVERAQSSKAPVQRLADRIAGVFVPIVLLIAVITFIAWAAFGDRAGWTSPVLSAVAVLVVACPCALGLATPAAIAAGTGRAARVGILFRDAEALEAAGLIDTVVWDKTGTLTTGRHQVSSIEASEQAHLSERELVRLAAAVERRSEHPLAAAIVAYADDLGLMDIPVSNFRSRPGLGAVALLDEGELLDEHEIAVGSARFMAERSLEVDERDHPHTQVYVARGGEIIGMIRLADELKPSAADAVTLLRRRGIESVLVSGDTEVAVQQAATRSGIGSVHARVLPSEKAEVIAQLQSAGRRVAMVGDGVNDAPALAQAELGLAMRTGSDLALETAQVGLMQSSPQRAAEAVLLGGAVRRVIRQNLAFAFAYNLLLIPLAGGLAVPIFDALGGVPGGLTWLFGVRGQFEPIAAALAMVASSLSVLANALRLTRWRP